MRIAVFSDSHGITDKMIRAVRSWPPDVIIHLGDHARDADDLKKEFPQTPIRVVRGNCDYASHEKEKDLFYAGALKVFMTHGHLYGVKLGLDSLINAAHFSGAELVLFGHTHKAENRRAGNIRLVNPGSAGAGSRTSYARVEIDDKGSVSCLIMDI